MADFWVEIAFTVLFRILKDHGKVTQYQKALCKLRDILNGMPLDCGTPTVKP